MRVGVCDVVFGHWHRSRVSALRWPFGVSDALLRNPFPLRNAPRGGCSPLAPRSRIVCLDLALRIIWVWSFMPHSHLPLCYPPLCPHLYVLFPAWRSDVVFSVLHCRLVFRSPPPFAAIFLWATPWTTKWTHCMPRVKAEGSRHDACKETRMKN